MPRATSGVPDLTVSGYIIGVSHTTCKDEFRQNIRSHSWSVFLFYNIFFIDNTGGT